MPKKFSVLYKRKRAQRAKIKFRAMRLALLAVMSSHSKRYDMIAPVA